MSSVFLVYTQASSCHPMTRSVFKPKLKNVQELHTFEGSEVTGKKKKKKEEIQVKK